jgi:hypothetical protein
MRIIPLKANTKVRHFLKLAGMIAGARVVPPG